ncbi:hypothetical protein Tco_1090997 [Tanacetum coccineum]|uniref:MAK10-like protein n=1 Tax=Tanacetum coccineum TaxID=301880 RepID=A0ABQ5I6X6_9ASTR
MGDENHIRTLGDYSKPSHEIYRNTIELPIGNNVVPLQFDTMSLVQNGCLFHGLQSKDPNQHLKDFLKLVDSLDLDGENRERTHLRNKITTLCEICSGPHETQHCIEDPEQAFVEYASSRTDEAGYARLSKFESDFKQQQSEMTKKIDTMLKTITDQIAGTLPSDTVKNPKLNTSPVLSACSYPSIDPQCSSHPSTSINAIKAHSKEANISQTSLLQTRMGIETQHPKEPEPTLEDEF